MPPRNIIELEELDDAFYASLQKVMGVVPLRHRQDKKLQRLIAFRLKLDGEGRTIEYLLYKIREINQCAYTGSLYEYLKDDHEKNACLNPISGEPPDEAG